MGHSPLLSRFCRQTVSADKSVARGRAVSGTGAAERSWGWGWGTGMRDLSYHVALLDLSSQKPTVKRDLRWQKITRERSSPVARAEGSVVVSLVGEGHAAQVRADADHNHELGLEAAVLVRFLVAEVLHVHGRLSSAGNSHFGGGGGGAFVGRGRGIDGRGGEGRKGNMLSALP